MPQCCTAPSLSAGLQGRAAVSWIAACAAGTPSAMLQLHRGNRSATG
ncbi:hypothetical protein BSTAB16_1248 [Burkholderia stabilis]|uniref:Uncharacterized protein n=1 Tax=Burkholderia stabilis TaxID=95485 RepID=A0AAJ5T386_9BURK|nr:hypothetical protein BSTAB16_1248 [Burkholderia stabilis]